MNIICQKCNQYEADIKCHTCGHVSCLKCIEIYDDLFIATVGCDSPPFWYNTGEVALICNQYEAILCAVCHDQSKKNEKYYCIKCYDKILLSSNIPNVKENFEFYEKIELF